jgi:hypothetical protein
MAKSIYGKKHPLSSKCLMMYRDRKAQALLVACAGGPD